MAETLLYPKDGTRAEIYRAITPQLAAIMDGEDDLIANLANIAAGLREAFGFFWVGFYLVKDDQLVLGPFQGPIACTRIAFDRGVCGHCYMTRKPVVVPNVDEFPGHIACSSASKSEVVVPLLSVEGRIIGVLDVDSDMLNDFSDVDVKGLEAILKLIAK